MNIVDTNENCTDLMAKGRYPYILFCSESETYTFVWRSRDLKVQHKTATAKQLEKLYSEKATIIMVYDNEGIPVGTFNHHESAAQFLEVKKDWLSMKLGTTPKNSSFTIKGYEVVVIDVNPNEDFLRFIGNGKWRLIV